MHYRGGIWSSQEEVPCFPDGRMKVRNMKKNWNSILISLSSGPTRPRSCIIFLWIMIILPSTLGVAVTTISFQNTIPASSTFTGSMLALSQHQRQSRLAQWALHSTYTSLLWFAYFFVCRPSCWCWPIKHQRVGCCLCLRQHRLIACESLPTLLALLSSSLLPTIAPKPSFYVVSRAEPNKTFAFGITCSTTDKNKTVSKRSKACTERKVAILTAYVKDALTFKWSLQL